MWAVSTLFRHDRTLMFDIQQSLSGFFCLFSYAISLYDTGLKFWEKKTHSLNFIRFIRHGKSDPTSGHALRHVVLASWLHGALLHANRRVSQSCTRLRRPERDTSHAARWRGQKKISARSATCGSRTEPALGWPGRRNFNYCRAISDSSPRRAVQSRSWLGPGSPATWCVTGINGGGPH